MNDLIKSEDLNSDNMLKIFNSFPLYGKGYNKVTDELFYEVEIYKSFPVYVECENTQMFACPICAGKMVKLKLYGTSNSKYLDVKIKKCMECGINVIWKDDFINTSLLTKSIKIINEDEIVHYLEKNDMFNKYEVERFFGTIRADVIIRRKKRKERFPDDNLTIDPGKKDLQLCAEEPLGNRPKQRKRSFFS